LKIDMTSFFAERGPVWIKFRTLVIGLWSKSKLDVEFQYGGRLGEFNGMSSQIHLPHCSVLPPGEFNAKSQSFVSHCRVLRQDEFNDMSSQSQVSHCRVLPLGEFTVMIPEPRVTLQGAV